MTLAKYFLWDNTYVWSGLGLDNSPIVLCFNADTQKWSGLK